MTNCNTGTAINNPNISSFYDSSREIPLIAALIKSPDTLNHLGSLKPSDFTKEEHRAIVEKALKLQNYDVHSLTKKLSNESQKLAFRYLTTQFSDHPDVINDYVATVVEMKRGRLVYERLNQAKTAIEDGLNLEDALKVLSEEDIQKSSSFSFNSGMGLFKPTPINWLVNGVLECDSLAGIFAASGSGKTFATLDMALCVAAGQDWHNHTVKQGKVTYVAGEGQAGIKRRIAAWGQRNGHHESIADNFLLLNRACQLPDDTDEFIRAIKQTGDLKLLVLDTLQRTFVGDENSTRDMTAYIRALDKIREAIPNLTIIVVHHTGHAAGDRARGSSVLRASLDAEIKLTKTEGNYITIACTKAKDSEPFAPITLQLKTETLEGWSFEDGQISSATLHRIESPIKPKLRKVLSNNQQEAMRVFNQLHDDAERKLKNINQDGQTPTISITDWIVACKEAGAISSNRLTPSDFRGRVVKPLEQQGYIEVVGAEKATLLYA